MTVLWKEAPESFFALLFDPLFAQKWGWNYD